MRECSRILNGAFGVSASQHPTQLEKWVFRTNLTFANPLRPDTQDVIARAGELRIQVKMITNGYVSIPKENTNFHDQGHSS